MQATLRPKVVCAKTPSGQYRGAGRPSPFDQRIAVGSHKAIRLREFRTVTGEQLIAAIARQNELSRARLKQFKSFSSAVFKHAKRLGLLDGENPMRDVSIPKSARGNAATFASSLEEIQ